MTDKFNWDTGFVLDFDLKTGFSENAKITKRHLSQMRGMFHDEKAYQERIMQGDPLVYEFYELGCPERAGDIAFGTTILYPGTVGDEYFMTKGHFHTDLMTAEIYYTLSGTGYMMLENKEGDWRALPLAAGQAVYVPRGYAHRTINSGDDPLIVFFAFDADAGHDYGTIETRGYRHLILKGNDGEDQIVPNPGGTDMPAEKVTTVLGGISPEALGFCQMHEHIMLRKGVPALLDPALMADDIEKSTQELSLLRAAGGCTVVDAQPIGCGRMAAELAEASRRSGITVIASTGFHVRRFYPSEHWLFDMTETDLEKLFCREITDGMYENCDLAFSGEATKHRAGIVKAALEERGLGKTERKLFAAAAFAARCCNVPLMIHTDRDSNPLELMDYLLSCDLPPEQMIFCHLDRTMPNGNVAKTLCAEGAYLEYDTIGRFKYHSDKEEIRRIEEILDAGWVKRLLLSLDTTNRRMLSYGGDIGLNYLLQTFLPAMHNSGISEAVLERIMHKNPKEVFGS